MLCPKACQFPRRRGAEGGIGGSEIRQVARILLRLPCIWRECIRVDFEEGCQLLSRGIQVGKIPLGREYEELATVELIEPTTKVRGVPTPLYRKWIILYKVSKGSVQIMGAAPKPVVRMQPVDWIS